MSSFFSIGSQIYLVVFLAAHDGFSALNDASSLLLGETMGNHCNQPDGRCSANASSSPLQTEVSASSIQRIQSCCEKKTLQMWIRSLPKNQGYQWSYLGRLLLQAQVICSIFGKQQGMMIWTNSYVQWSQQLTNRLLTRRKTHFNGAKWWLSRCWRQTHVLPRRLVVQIQTNTILETGTGFWPTTNCALNHNLSLRSHIAMGQETVDKWPKLPLMVAAWCTILEVTTIDEWHQ